MDWLSKLLETVAGGLPSAATALCPEHIKRKWLERLSDKNPFKTISANHDLVRATRLAWIEAAQAICGEVVKRSELSEWKLKAPDILRFNTLITDVLIEERDHALDRRHKPKQSPIDLHVNEIVTGVPELIAPGENIDVGNNVTVNFSTILASLISSNQNEIPAIYQQIASEGLTSVDGNTTRSFGELVFSAFAELIKDPQKYPQAGKAFLISMDKLSRDIADATLKAILGLDKKLDDILLTLDYKQTLNQGVDLYQKRFNLIEVGVKDANKKLDEIIRMTATIEGLPLFTLRALLNEMGDMTDLMDIKQIGDRLKQKAVEFRNLTSRLQQFSADDPEVTSRRHAASEALNEGNFVLADSHLSAAEQRDLEGLEKLEALAKHKRLSAAESRAERAISARLRTNPSGYLDAAGHFDEAARLASTVDAGISHGYARQKGQALCDLGTEFGVNKALSDSIDHFKRIQSDISKYDDPLNWSKTQFALANSLKILGERESGNKRLLEAVATYRLAIASIQRDEFPVYWGKLYNSLGHALWTIGERELGDGYLREAVYAYELSLKSLKYSEAPVEWGEAKHNIGTALQSIGEREEGVENLRKAVRAYHSALKVRTKEKYPLHWAATINNLGTAFFWIGQRTKSPQEYRKSASCFRLILSEYRRDRVPLDWAMAQSNLGEALRGLGELDQGTELLEQAADAFRAALIEYREDRVPLDWAMVLGNLGDTLCTMGFRKLDLSLANQALAMLQKAEHVFIEANHHSFAEAFKKRIASAHREIDEIKSIIN